jgi:hypothetical protein
MSIYLDFASFQFEKKKLFYFSSITCLSPVSLLQFQRMFVCLFTEKLIGVHCTHGLNRTGFFVCAYMVLCNNLLPSDVLRNFQIARGYPIERGNYISSIIQFRSNNELKQTIRHVGRSRWSDKNDETHRSPAHYSRYSWRSGKWIIHKKNIVFKHWTFPVEKKNNKEEFWRFYYEMKINKKENFSTHTHTHKEKRNNLKHLLTVHWIIKI